jgi:acyl dehydratase
MSEPSGRPGRYYEDYPVGAVFTGGPITVSEQEILDFARRYDPQPMHVDRAAAQTGQFGGLIASGWHTGALMMQLLAAHFIPRPGTSPRRVSTNCAGCARCGPATGSASGPRYSARGARVQEPIKASSSASSKC